MKLSIISVLIVCYLKFVGLTSRIVFYGEENLPEKPYLFVFWHMHILFASYTHRNRDIGVIVSTSKDGDLSAKTNKLLGHKVIRGTSSSKRAGAKTTIKILSSLKEGNVVALTPDGSKGPARVAKLGASYISAKINCPMVPISWAAKKVKILSSWDSTVVPLPFNRIVVLTGPPIYTKSEEDLEMSAKNLSVSLDNLSDQASALLGTL